MMHGNSNIKFN